MSLSRPIFNILTSFLLVGALLTSQAAAKKPDSPSQPLTSNYQTWAEVEETHFTRNQPQLNAAFPDHDWWNTFNDPHLNTYILDALKNNPNANAARIRIEETRAQVMDTASKLWPSLNVNPSFTRIKFPGGVGLPGIPNPLHLYQIPLQASYELDLFGKNIDKTKSVQKEAEATVWDNRTVEIALVSDVASAYFNLLRSDALVQSQTENLALLTRIHDLKLNQNKLGIVSFDEVIRADRDVAQAQSELNTYQKQQALFAHQLSILTGAPPRAEQSIERASLDAIALPDQTRTGLPSELVLRRPDILARENRLSEAGIDVRVARKAFLPTLNLSTAFTLFAFKFGDVFNWDNLLNQQAVNIAQPIFKGGSLRAQLRLRKARYREAIENYRQTILNAFKDVDDSLTRIRAGYQDLDSNAKRLELTKKDLGLRENLLHQGLVPGLDVLQSRSEVIQYQQLATQSKADALIATVSLYKALGGGY